MFTKNNKNTMRFNSYILNNCLYIQVVWLELTEQRHESAMKYCYLLVTKVTFLCQKRCM